MRVIFMGTPDFAVGTLTRLIESKHEVVLAVTQPDKPRGRGKEVRFSPVKEEALKHGIEVYQPKQIKIEESVEFLRKYEPDVIVVVAFGQILSKQILDMPKYGCINVHASLLPKYRGAAPIQWAVLNGDEISGVTTMRMDEGLDTGDIMMKQEVELSKKETAGSLFERLMEIGGELLIKTLIAVEDETISYTPQEHDKATKTRLITKEMGKINFERPACEIERLVRGMNPWPSAYCRLDGKNLKIWDCEVISNDENIDEKALNTVGYGGIVGVSKKNVFVKTGDGILKLNEIQLEGKRRMNCEEFLRGYSISLMKNLNERR